jgi:NTE family protein
MRALVLGGGGAKGAYEAGALYHFVGERKIHYDIITGTSVGALNGTLLAQFPKGREGEAAEELKKLWFSLDTPMIYRKWYWGLLWFLPIFWKPSAFTSAPLRKLVYEKLRVRDVKDSGKKLRVGATSLTTGERRIWTEESADLAEGVLASSAFPGGFEPVVSGGEVYLDDGLREITPIGEAVSAGATRVDVISLDTERLRTGFVEGSVIKGAPRVLEAMLHEIDVWDYKGAELYNDIIELACLLPADKIPKRILDKVAGKQKIQMTSLRPQLELGNPLDFSPAAIRVNFERGYTDATRAAW